MSVTDWREQLPPKVRIVQIIVAGLFSGCFCFLIIAVLVAKNMNNAVAEQPLLTYLSLALAGMILGLRFILPGIIISHGRKAIHGTLVSADKQARDTTADDKKEKENSKALALIQVFINKTIVAGAMLEGAVLFLLVVYMVEHSMLSVVATVVLLVLLIIQMPTTDRVTIWIEEQMRLVDEERTF